MKNRTEMSTLFMFLFLSQSCSHARIESRPVELRLDGTPEKSTVYKIDEGQKKLLGELPSEIKTTQEVRVPRDFRTGWEIILSSLGASLLLGTVGGLTKSDTLLGISGGVILTDVFIVIPVYGITHLASETDEIFESIDLSIEANGYESKKISIENCTGQTYFELKEILPDLKVKNESENNITDENSKSTHEIINNKMNNGDNKDINISDRLIKLKKLREEGLIDKVEYENKKKELIDLL